MGVSRPSLLIESTNYIIVEYYVYTAYSGEREINFLSWPVEKPTIIITLAAEHKTS